MQKAKTFVGFLFLLLAFPLCVQAQMPGSPAPRFEGTTPESKTLHLEDFQGRVVLLDFWASWCGPCRQEMPFLVELYESHQDDLFEVIAINVDEETADMQAFLSGLDTPVPFHLIRDPDGQLPTLYDLAAMPTSVLIDGTGMLRFRHDGFKESEKGTYRAEVQQLLNELNTEGSQ